MGFSEEVTVLAVLVTEQCLSKERSRESIQAARMVHLIIIIAEYVCHFLVAKQSLNLPAFITAMKGVIRSQAKLGIL